MTRYVYYTATTLDGFLADDQDSLSWLFRQEIDQGGKGGYDGFIEGIGALAMGATTYEWIVRHLGGEPWSYTQPSLVFTHRDLAPVHETVSIVQETPASHRAALEEAAGGRDVWVVGGGDLAAQFAEDGLLDEVQVACAPVTLGRGRPLFPRRWDLALESSAVNGAFVCSTYRVLGPLAEDQDAAVVTSA